MSVFLITTVVQLCKKPSHDREWREDAILLSKTIVKGQTVEISNVRNWRYNEQGPIDTSYEKKSYDLRKLNAVWFIMEPFSSWDAVGHSMLLFDFLDGESVLISVEARKEKDETYSAWKGLWKEFELIYLWGTQEDFLVRRVIVQHHPLRMHKLKLKDLTKQALFRAFVVKTNQTVEKPEFYHTLFTNCTNELAHTANNAKAKSVPFSRSRVLTGYADKTLYDRGLIDTSLSWKKQLEASRIDPFIKENYEDPAWGRKLREKHSKKIKKP